MGLLNNYWAIHMQHTSRHELLGSRAMLFAAVAGSMFLSYTGLWVLANMAETPVLAFGGLFLALYAIRNAYLNGKLLINKTPMVVITDEQIECIQWPFKSIKWKNIDDATLTRMPVSGGYSLNLDVNNQDQLLSQISPPRRLLWKLGRLFGFSPIAINLLGLRETPKELEEIVRGKLRKSA